MHPGNIFVSYEHPENPKDIGIDCGIVGSLNKEDKRYLAENFIAFFNRDYRKVAELHVDSGWVPPDTNVEEFEFAIRTVCEPIFEKPLAEISFGHVLLICLIRRVASIWKCSATGVTPENPALRRRGRTPALSATRFMENGEAFPESWIKDQVGIPALVRAFKEKRRSGSKKCQNCLNWLTTVCARASIYSTVSIRLPASFSQIMYVRDNRVIFSELALR